MQDLKQIKLIIWDLDETLWSGTLSESNIFLKEDYITFIKDTMDIGIIHSICSKNDYTLAKQKLQKIGLWDYFVFPSINWEPKGPRIKNIIDNMALRAVNVLFVDDNLQNLNEAKYFCPEIKVDTPLGIEAEFEIVKNLAKTDLQHKRLKQYKLLQKKNEEKQQFDSNEEFLYSCRIQVDILYDCLNHIERIYDLLIRSNQLNYTKNRPTKQELNNILKDPQNKCGYVNVKDRFGDYGLVGFFVLKNDKLIHYTFSCRILGMRIEQYIYMLLKCPRLDIVSPVVSLLNTNEFPKWINQKQVVDSTVNENTKIKEKILLKGPCDMQSIFSFIKESDNILGEFSYTNTQGVLTEGHNHTAQILTALEATEEEKRLILSEFAWIDKDSLTTKILAEKYDFIVLSMLTDGNLGIYRHKKTGRCMAFCERYYDLTSLENRDKYCKKEIFTSNISFSESDLSLFAKSYEYVDNCDGEITIANLERIRELIPLKTKLILILGSEMEFKGKTKPSYINRHIFHRMLNKKIRNWAEDKNNVVLIPFDKFIHSQKDFLDSINHFVKRVYYDLTYEILNIIGVVEESYKFTSKSELYYQSIIQKMRVLKNNVIKFIQKKKIK